MGQAAGWSGVQKVLHWTMAAAIAVEVPVGFIMGWTYADKTPQGAAKHLLSSQIHHTLGLLLLAAVLWRLTLRMRNTAPPAPDGTSPAQARLASGLQGLLYLGMLIVPLSGWAALSSLGSGGGYPAPPIWFFGHDGFGPGGMIPHIVPPVPWNAHTLFKYGFFGAIHRWALIIGGCALALHIAGALMHQFVLRDGLIGRMWRG
ncbi:hypothetical protein GTZ99_00395 [Novosphingobium sp. FSY-8]|uniref:Cytochrome b561 bacterial/Ni-hydrogenase domain-containing protein n=1 Tax=Novosphingobium ovatum TaxID=1908523 RepID=A0ABW9X907_9SPHN|nr:cytochrome b/b6 domain-containing protein [Novosphingobium ovatum]NBC35013.1 hypothetical protein [Novosphingobium ovatum]